MSESDNVFYAVRLGRHPGVYRSWCVVLSIVPPASINGVITEILQGAMSDPGFQVPERGTRDFCNRAAGVGLHPWRRNGLYVAELFSLAFAWTDLSAAVNLSANSRKKGKSRAASTGEPPIAQGWTVVYTDGACSDNQDAAKARAGVGVWWAKDDPR
jgi:hypothetical protein